MKLTALKRSNVKHVMVFGPPKSGKTQLVGELARKYNLIWFDLEQGILTLRYSLPLEAQERIEVIQIPDNKGFPVAAATMMQVIKGGPCNICWEHGMVGCSVCLKAGKAAEFTKVELNALDENTVVVMDSGTQLTSSMFAHILRGKSDDYKPERDDFGELSRVSFAFYSFVQTAKFNFVCITHESIEKMEDGKTEKIVPAAGSGVFARSVAKYFDEVIYVEIKNSKHKAGSSTLYSQHIMTGSRTGVKLEDKDRPSLFDIFDPSFVLPTTDTEKAKAMLSSIPLGTGVKKS